MEDDNFGRSVAIHGNYILVGVDRVDKNDSSDVGAADIFGNPTNDPNTFEWTQLQQWQSNDLTKNDYFGISVAMDDNIAIIGTEDTIANVAFVIAPVDSTSVLSVWTHQMAWQNSLDRWVASLDLR
jgi:hypothetical protein